jgi:RluA family pseudouridine synthase
MRCPVHKLGILLTANMDEEYFFTYVVSVKERWRNRAILDVLTSEYKARSREYFLDALECGAITVNDEIVGPSRRLGMQDVIKHTVHMHEPPQPRIEVIKWEEDYVVVNKPIGIPCHPTGGYMRYSVTKTLFKDRKVACVNRLDMPVSGVLILVFNNHSRWLSEIKNANKIYMAKVKGRFPDETEVNKRIKCVEGRHRFVSDEGKECQTFFRRLEFSSGHSLVECRPVTGRTHQIRIHLQSIGFPVVNDVMYGEGEAPCFESSGVCGADIGMFKDRRKYECVVRHCKGRASRAFNIKDSYICLHAWKYTYNGTEYVAPLPKWCSLSE